MKTGNFLKHAAIGLALSLAAAMAHATPVSWVLSGVTFNDGATASGSFVFDATTGIFSDVSIVTSAGFTYTTNELSPVPFGVGAGGLELVDNFVAGNNNGKSILNLDFINPLTDLGITTDLLVGFPSFQGQCSSGDCSGGTIFRTVTAGSVMVAAPEPATLVIFALGLVGAGAMRRRKI